MKYDLAAFDFDGTLADTLPWFNSIMDNVAEKYGFRKTNAEERAMLRRRSIPEILQFLGISIWKMPTIISYTRTLMSQIGPDVPLFDGIAEALHAIKASGLRMAVISANSTENIQRILGPELTPLFDHYECGTDLFGKPAKIAHLLELNQIAPERFILIGDELRDIEAARKAGIRVGVVPWGYNNLDTLLEQNPDEVFFSTLALGKLGHAEPAA